MILVFFPFFIPVYHTWLLFYSLFHLGSCVVIIYIIAVIVNYYGSDLYLVQITLDLACIRGTFSSRIYVADSYRNSVFTYFKKRDVTACKRKKFGDLKIINPSDFNASLLLKI